MSISAPHCEKNVGILAIEVYTPSTFVTQEKLEEYSGVSKGKYTIGLGQEGIAICGDCEDVNSLSLTVVQSLLEKYEVNPCEIGRLEVGTETIIDKSKSTKTILMDLFGSNTDIEGATIVNACYGGTAALLNAFNWVESDGWDGRYAIVVAADIAAYAKGAARPTCGAGAVAVLIGRDAPISFSNPKAKVTHAANVWDFFKPDHTVEYPTVDGSLSQECYYKALEDCYSRFANKMDSFSLEAGVNHKIEKKSSECQYFNAETPDYFVFHAPYNKLVQKSYARLFLLDARREFQRKVLSSGNEHTKDCNEKNDLDEKLLEDWLNVPIEDTHSDRELDGVLKKMSLSSYKSRLTDSNVASQKIGNTYTASVFLGIASLIDRAGRKGDLKPGKNIVIFSYGSGALASMYMLQIRIPSQSRFSILKMTESLNLMHRLESREEVRPCELDYALETRARMHHAGAPYSPIYPTTGCLFPGTFYLNNIDSKWVRTYSRIPLDAKMRVHGSPLVPPMALHLAKGDAESELSTAIGNCHEVSHLKEKSLCVITGISAGLPGSDGNVFQPDNLRRLLSGEQCIKPINKSLKTALLEKNVVQLKRLPDGSTERHLVNTEGKIIKLAARLGEINLTELYGVPKGLADTMDVAAKIAVAAGMEALKDAGLVSGKSNDPREWKVSDKYRDRTGIVYASSFPAMDAAIGEVMRFLQSKSYGSADLTMIISALRSRITCLSPNSQLSDADEAALKTLLSRATEIEKTSAQCSSDRGEYEFDRKFLFKVVVLANSQLAQLTGCRGPNTQTNAACAGTTQAIGMAQDMLFSGRVDRVVIIAGDNASGDTLLPWLGSGFRALGATTIAASVEEGSCPFDKRRSGMLIGAGGIGMVLETKCSFLQREISIGSEATIKACLLGTQCSNSAFHGAALDRKHIASELNRFLSDMELIHGICKTDLATHGVYFSHETSTHASDESSCSGNEVAALREVFGDELLSKLLILNTKGFTGHAMGVSFEDVAAVEVLLRQTVPPVVNYTVKDEYLGELNISKGGHYSCKYALRFAAGFGSQVVFALYATAQYK